MTALWIVLGAVTAIVALVLWQAARVGKVREVIAHLLFFLLTPAGAPREQVRLLARVARLLESEYVAERLRHAATATDILEVVREGDPSN